MQPFLTRVEREYGDHRVGIRHCHMTYIVTESWTNGFYFVNKQMVHTSKNVTVTMLVHLNAKSTFALEYKHE